MFFSKLIPEHIISKLYTRGSLTATGGTVTFSLKNRLIDAALTQVISVTVNKQTIPLRQISIFSGIEESVRPEAILPESPLNFPVRSVLQVVMQQVPQAEEYRVEIAMLVTPFGKLHLNFTDKALPQKPQQERSQKIPRNENDDYTPEIIKNRLRYAENVTNQKLNHLAQHTFDPVTVKGNCESFIGAAQVPVGLAGPLRINGEHAKGDFLVPMATTEGTLVASYNRGIKIINLCGGVMTTVSEDLMQRAPVFVFADARQARSFKEWVEEQFSEIKEIVEASSRFARLVRIESYLSNNFAFLRFNYRTGDAAGQNMVTKATYEGCLWMLEKCRIKSAHFFLESNMATDKKPSMINSLLTRGKRVTAEVTFKKEVLEHELGVTAKQLDYHRSVASIGALLSGVNNNGLHSVNAIAAIFIATGQDVANIAESSACLAHAEVLPNGDLYASVTLPSLIVASYGGGTGLATQRECLELMECYGEGKAKKLAEIVAGVVAAGEISLAAAISSADWVSSHEAYGRNR